MKGRRSMLPTLSESDIEEPEEEHQIPSQPTLSPEELTLPFNAEDTEEVEEEGEDSGPLFESESELLAQALIREFLHRKGYTPAFQEFALQVPSNQEPTKRKDLAEKLHLADDFKMIEKGISKGPNKPSVLELLIRSQLRCKPKKRAVIHTPTGGSGLASSAQSYQANKKLHEQLDVSNDGTEAMVGGKYILSGSNRAKVVGELAPPKALADLRMGRVISNIDDLDMASEVRLGAGASGAVYKVLHKPTGTYIALKKIKVDQSEQRAQVYKELTALYTQANQASTPARRNIVALHGAFFQEGMVLLALECMSGSLDDIIEKNAPATSPSSAPPGVPEEVLQAIAYQILNALHYLHKERHMIHRDIKPANILYNDTGEIKISDFGVASEELMKTVANAKTFVGTTIYMSPERLKAAPYNNKADIWSFGLVLYVLGTNVNPWRGMNFYQILSKTQEEPLSMPSSFSPACRQFVDSCLQISPKQRASTTDLKETKWMEHMTDGKSERILCEYLDRQSRFNTPSHTKGNAAQHPVGSAPEFSALDSILT